MSKLLVVFGATGQQGGSIVSYVAKELSSQYKIRGITRDPSKPSALKLKELGVEVVAADVTDKESLKAALQGADTVFSMSSMNLSGKDDEFKDGKNVADAAVEAGAKYLIWSTLPPVSKLSNGEFTHVQHFDKKAEVEQYIRGLPIKSAFYAPGVFFQNFQGIMKPQPGANDTYALFNVMRPTSTMPWIDVVADSGKFVGQILKNPETYEGKTIYGAQGHYSIQDIAEIISKDSNQKVTYTQIPDETFRSFMPPLIADDITEMFKFHDKFGYYGPSTNELVSQTLSEIDFKPTSPTEYLKANPINFD